MEKTITVGDASLEITDQLVGKVTIRWGEKSKQIALCAFSDPEHKTSVNGAKVFKRSGKALTQAISVGKILKDKPSGQYYLVATAEGFENKPVSFEWTKPEVVTNAPTPAPTEESAPESKPPAPPTVTETIPTKVAPPADTTVTPDENLVLTSVSERLDVIEMTQRLWAEKLQRQTFKPKDLPAIPSWIAEMELRLEKIKQILLRQSDPKFNQAQTRADECSMWLVEFKKKVGQLQAPTKPAPIPTPAPAAPSIPTPVPTPAQPPTPDLSGRVEKLEEGLGNLGIEVGNTGNRVTKVDAKVDKLGTSLEESLNTVLGEIKEEIKGLKTSPSPAPTTQPALPATPPPSSGGSGTGDNGGQQTSTKPKPEKNWLIWFVLLAGILGTILLLLGIGGWIRSAFLEGVLLGSKGTPTSMMVPATATTNTAPVPQAVAPPVTTSQAPTLTQAELEAFATKHLAMQAEHNKAIEKMVGLAATTSSPATITPTTAHQTAETKAGVTINGNGKNIVAGRDVTVINNYNHSFPTSSGDKNGSVATLQSSKPVTMGGVVPQWSPTLMSGYVCVPLAADGSGSEGYWIYGILTTVRGV